MEMVLGHPGVQTMWVGLREVQRNANFAPMLIIFPDGLQDANTQRVHGTILDYEKPNYVVCESVVSFSFSDSISPSG